MSIPKTEVLGVIGTPKSGYRCHSDWAREGDELRTSKSLCQRHIGWELQSATERLQQGVSRIMVVLAQNQRLSMARKRQRFSGLSRGEVAFICLVFLGAVEEGKADPGTRLTTEMTMGDVPT